MALTVGQVVGLSGTAWLEGSAVTVTGGTGDLISADGSSTVDLTGWSFTDNDATPIVFDSDSTLTCTDCVFTGNTEGCIEASGFAALDVSGSSFTGNALSGNGGALRLEGTGSGIAMDVTLDDAVFEDNEVTGSGGAISATQGSLSLSGLSFSGNIARTGGALHGEITTLTDVVFHDNSASYGGGAIALSGGEGLEIIGGEILRNSSGLGGAVITWSVPVSLSGVDLGTGSDENTDDDINGNSSRYTWDGSGVVTVSCTGQVECE